MEVLISILTSVCVCSVFMYWYEKKLDIEIKTLMEEMKKVTIEAFKEVNTQNINEILDRFEKITNKKEQKWMI